jgi:hypothetical protein
MGNKFCKLITKNYIKNPNTKTTYILVSTQNEIIEKKHYDNIVNASKFFRSIGGTETHQKEYTSKGYITTKLTSISPNKINKTIREFIFD